MILCVLKSTGSYMIYCLLSESQHPFILITAIMCVHGHWDFMQNKRCSLMINGVAYSHFRLFLWSKFPFQINSTRNSEHHSTLIFFMRG